MKHRNVRGKINYTSTKPEWQGKERGREWFNFSHHADGSIIMSAQCEIEEPDPTVLRNITYHIGPGMVPQNLLVHLTLGDEFLGSGWMRHDAEAGTISCESYGPSIGRNSQLREDVGEFDGFGTHPVVGDGFLTRIMDVAKGPHKRRLRVFLPSPDHRGATPPQISEVFITLEYVGEEEKTVAAGTFQCRHFRFVDDAPEGMGGTTHPDYDMWVTADEDNVLVYGSIDGYMMNRYELVELER
ncbi:hypothetical protein [Erythrobacter sp. HL-111]|uniref:hypothetical protein n=1 Tax=Erythrobacter sp. HL-111 TaxID=1798193 RepID=UPI0006DB947F|nr:hypothetical protein [Erythrobacter sp. HL-111]KPP94886.1 MAG: Protein of unknown function (DUF3108) [Erythrobacteraceae bacterium HL-111]SDS89771.1 hypothetical protein SAMN04515621_2464 [Erythrobacter sp. HL-111]